MFKIFARTTILLVATVLTVTMVQAATKKTKPRHNDARVQACIAKCVAGNARTATEMDEDDPDDPFTPAQRITMDKNCVPICQRNPAGNGM